MLQYLNEIVKSELIVSYPIIKDRELAYKPVVGSFIRRLFAL